MAPWEIGNPVWTTWCMNQRCGIPFRLNGVSTRLMKSCFSLMTLLKGLRNSVSDGWCLRKNCGILFHGNGVSKKNAELCFWSMVPPTKNAEICCCAFAKMQKNNILLTLSDFDFAESCFWVVGVAHRIAEFCF